MKIQKIQNNISLKRKSENKEKKNRELIDVISDAVRNPRDVNDCVAVPRGIFKAYMLIMSGSGLLGISALLPKKWNIAKGIVSGIGWILNILSAVYFAKPFAVKGLSPTVKKEDIEKTEN
ncbi:MAG: hypothetical protein MJ237_01155 [bacterium]|nr:hypothetical protein [bacterium]